jgi:hypothetical protein
MSTTIEGISGSRWHIRNGAPTVRAGVAIDSRGDAGNRIFKVADVLNAMKAEGVLDAVEIIAELPRVEESPGGKNVYVRGVSFNVDGGGGDASDYRQRALSQLAVARHLEAKEAEKELEAIKRRAAELELSKRRERIVSRHARGLGAHDYDSLDVNGKYIVDTIRELEECVAAK